MIKSLQVVKPFLWPWGVHEPSNEGPNVQVSWRDLSLQSARKTCCQATGPLILADFCDCFGNLSKLSLQPSLSQGLQHE